MGDRRIPPHEVEDLVDGKFHPVVQRHHHDRSGTDVADDCLQTGDDFQFFWRWHVLHLWCSSLPFALSKKFALELDQDIRYANETVRRCHSVALADVVADNGIAYPPPVGLANTTNYKFDARESETLLMGQGFGVATDIQTGQATMCYLPGIETPERECWYINMGAVDREFFTTQAMVKAAP